MRKYILIGALAAISLTGACADHPGADWMPKEAVKQKLMNAGYERITELEADDGHWEGEGFKAVKKMQFHADPKTGAITSERPDD